MHCALLRESLEAGKTFPIIVGWNKPSVERVVLKVRVSVGDAASSSTNHKATCIQESYSRGAFSFSLLGCINFLFFFYSQG